MKLTNALITFGFIALSLYSLPANAQQFTPCGGYADTAVWQQQENVANGCSFRGARWHTNRQAHREFCDAVGWDFARSGNTERQRDLMSCRGRGNAAPPPAPPANNNAAPPPIPPENNAQGCQAQVLHSIRSKHTDRSVAEIRAKASWRSKARSQYGNDYGGEFSFRDSRVRCNQESIPQVAYACFVQGIPCANNGNGRACLGDRDLVISRHHTNVDQQVALNQAISNWESIAQRYGRSYTNYNNAQDSVPSCRRRDQQVQGYACRFSAKPCAF